MNEFDWIDELSNTKLETDKTYVMNFPNTPFNTVVMKDKLYELFGNEWEDGSNGYVNWFNNPNIHMVGNKCLLFFYVMKQSPYIRAGWDYCESSNSHKDEIELTLETFLNSWV